MALPPSWRNGSVALHFKEREMEAFEWRTLGRAPELKPTGTEG